MTKTQTMYSDDERLRIDVFITEDNEFVVVAKATGVGWTIHLEDSPNSHFAKHLIGKVVER